MRNGPLLLLTWLLFAVGVSTSGCETDSGEGDATKGQVATSGATGMGGTASMGGTSSSASGSNTTSSTDGGSTATTADSNPGGTTTDSTDGGATVKVADSGAGGMMASSSTGTMTASGSSAGGAASTADAGTQGGATAPETTGGTGETGGGETGGTGEILDEPPGTCPDIPAPLTAGDIPANLEHDGRTRSYLLHVPPGLATGEPVALVVDFPPVLTGATRGVPTSIAVPPLSDHFSVEADFTPVWPHPLGTVAGLGLEPIHRAVPEAAMKNPELHQWLALTDAVRAGRGRERALAVKELQRRLS